MFKRYQKNLIYVFILLFPFILFFARPQRWLSPQWGQTPFLSGIVRTFAVPLKELKKILYYHRTFDEYKKLEEEVSVLRARLIGVEEVTRENARLENLLQFSRRLVYSYKAANVIAREPSRWRSSFVIDKGESDGLALGMPVVNAQGVVGRIAEVQAQTAKVILLNDPQFSVAALVQRPRESGLVSGTLKGLCRLRYVDKDADVRVGDKVITSKLSSSFPEHLIIGEVIQKIDNPGAVAPEYIVQPAVAFSRVEEVLVILE